MSYISYMSYANYMSYVNYMGYVKLCELGYELSKFYEYFHEWLKIISFFL